MKKFFLLLVALILLGNKVNYAQVAINTDGSAPNSSAMLDVSSTDKGLLIPRLTTAQRNTLASTAVAGLMVYDTNLNRFFFFNGTTWDGGSVGNLWTRSGAFTNLTNTSDFVGIGNNNPDQRLDVRAPSGTSFIQVKSFDSHTGLIIDKGNISQKSYIIYATTGVNKWYAGLIGDDNYAISTSSSSTYSKLYIKNTGNVGIGTISPGANLEVAGTTETAIRITRPSSSYGAVLGFYTGYTSEWNFVASSSNDDMLISRGSGNTTGNLGLMSNGGNVGIGTTTPARNFEVSGPIQTARLSSASLGAYLEFVGSNSTDWAIGTNTGSMRLASSTNEFATSTDQYLFSATFFHPYSNNVRELGLSNYRWKNIYSVSGNFSGAVATGALTTSGNATFSGTVATGALTTTGNATISGNVGIGTLSPARTLEIVSSIWQAARISSTAAGAVLEFKSDNTTNWALGSYSNALRILATTNNFSSVTDEYYITRSELRPWSTNNKTLGSSDVRWSTLYSGVGDFSSAGTGIAGATVHSENTGTAGIAGSFATNGSDATVVLGQNGSGKFLKAFGPNGGNEEISIDNNGNINLYNSSHVKTIQISPVEGAGTTAGQITMYNAAGAETIAIDGDYGDTGDGRITTNEIQITGGSDLSELFDLSDYDNIQKGMVVIIDEDKPGSLKVSQTAYDRKVAGIVSGANDIKPGLIMSQKGTIADGEHLIALSGRVYCMVDASESPIKVGDMLTTSSVPGHAMKVEDFDKARGAVIGKAMTSLDSGKGLVLVLVSLQ